MLGLHKICQDLYFLKFWRPYKMAKSLDIFQILCIYVFLDLKLH